MKKAVILILTVLAVLLPACQKTPDAFELITRQDFDWSTREEKPFIIESREYMLIDIHELAEEDLKTSTIVNESVDILWEDDAYYVVLEPSDNSGLKYYLLFCEKLGLYFLVPHKERPKLFNEHRALGFCLAPV